MQGAVGDPGHPGAAGVDPRVQHPLAGRQLPHPARAGQVGHEQPAGQGEAGHGQVEVGGEGDDAAGALPGPLPPGPLLGRQAVGAVAEQAGRVGDQPLGPGGHLQHPQPVDRVVAGGRAQERHPGAVGPDLEPPRPPQGEPLGPRVPPGEGPGLPVPRGATAPLQQPPGPAQATTPVASTAAPAARAAAMTMNGRARIQVVLESAMTSMPTAKAP